MNSNLNEFIKYCRGPYKWIPLVIFFILSIGTILYSVQRLNLRKTIHQVRIPNDIDYWAKNKYGEMVLPILLPTKRLVILNERIKIWLYIPPGKKISAKWIESQKRYTLVYPSGTIADRVEQVNSFTLPWGTHVRAIGDVRGTRIDDKGGEFFHVYGPSLKEEEWILGFEWPRVNQEVDKLAREKLIHLYFPNFEKEGASSRAAAGFRTACTNCHKHDNPPRLMKSELFESDSAGFFNPIGVLQDSLAIRDQRPWDWNADNSYISVWCGNIQVKAEVNGESRKYPACKNGEAPIGKLDLKLALQKGDAHAKALCESRRFLFNNMDSFARDSFKNAFEKCGIITKSLN